MNTTSHCALIVDSDLAWRERFALALSEHGFCCELGEDGEQALRMLDAKSFDLVVTELVLPRVHGHSLAVHALSHFSTPRIVVLTSLADPRLARDLLTRGVDDFLHKSTPVELLATKLQALFELENWRRSQQNAQRLGAYLSPHTMLEIIEQQLQVASEFHWDRVTPLFNRECVVPDLPSGVRDFANRLDADERAAVAAGLMELANTRDCPRVKLLTTAVAVEVDQELNAISDPVKLMIRNISTSGVKLLHTRVPATNDLVLSWPAETLPGNLLRLPLSVTRCRAIGRFYEIGGQFDIPTPVAAEQQALLDRIGVSTN